MPPRLLRVVHDPSPPQAVLGPTFTSGFRGEADTLAEAADKAGGPGEGDKWVGVLRSPVLKDGPNTARGEECPSTGIRGTQVFSVQFSAGGEINRGGDITVRRTRRVR